jgi:DNA-binding response OmpR family regulator
VLARVWKGEAFVTERSVDALVKRLRRKIEGDPGNPAYVLTVWGTGYKFADD